MDNLRSTTKTDLQLLRQELMSMLSGLATREELLAVRTELREEMLTLRAEAHQSIALIRKDMEILATTMTVRLGSMLMFGLGLLFAALKLT